MVYIVMAGVAVFCFAFCIIMLVKVEQEPEWHRPAWQDVEKGECSVLTNLSTHNSFV